MVIRPRELGLSLSFLLLLLLAKPLPAQVNTASLTGLIADQSNAPIGGVHVVARNDATGYSRGAETDSAGYYSFQNLPIGTYHLSVSRQGFETLREDVTLNTAQKVRRDFVLKVGAEAQTVEVSGSAPGLSRDDASIGTIINNETVEKTPLYLRNWDDLLRAVAGVQISRFTQQSGATSAGRVGDFNVHGVHSLQNNFILDGVDNNTFSENVQELSTEASHPSVDTIQEFNIITNPYSAEYGRAPGAAVSVSTKSGTNQFHGVAYEYLRNNDFDANDYFSVKNGLKKPENNQNQFGGNFGGPILKNKLFGFFDYEGTRIKQGVSRIATVPLPNERIGDFSPETAAALGLPAYPAIYDQGTGQPFADNQIPSGSIDPVMAQLFALFPQPNLPGDVNNYARNALAVPANRPNAAPHQGNRTFLRRRAPRLRAVHPAHQRVFRGSAFVDGLRIRRGRLEGDAEIDLEPWPPIRLCHAGTRGPRQNGEFRSRREWRRRRLGVRQFRFARPARAGRDEQEGFRAAGWLRVLTGSEDRHPGRIWNLLHAVRAVRQRGPARLKPAVPHQ
jgi:Carboxypeptidase regulatory-like domain/TonB-dependent Receptor Plug Domain